MKTETFFLLLFLVSSLAHSDNRDFIGTRTESGVNDSYTETAGKALVFFTGFNRNDDPPPFTQYGNIGFNVSDEALRIPVRTLRRNAKSGGYYYNKPLDLASSGFSISVDRTIPSGNPDLGTSLIFFPESSPINEVTGLPESYLRYFKRAKVETIEYKNKETRPKLLWARNMKVEPLAEERVSFSISRKSVVLTVQDSIVFSDSNPAKGFNMVRCGLWASTKGTTHGGGNLKFDRIAIESFSQ